MCCVELRAGLEDISSMRAGWMRPSWSSFSSVMRAISRRTPSKPESTTAFGVSSMMKSTPVRFSNARMLRPSRPMMRPFMSSRGSWTTDTVVSAAWPAAMRCMTTQRILRTRRSASRLVSSSTGGRARPSCRAWSSISFSRICLACEALRPATRSRSTSRRRPRSAAAASAWSRARRRSASSVSRSASSARRRSSAASAWAGAAAAAATAAAGAAGAGVARRGSAAAGEPAPAVTAERRPRWTSAAAATRPTARRAAAITISMVFQSFPLLTGAPVGVPGSGLRCRYEATGRPRAGRGDGSDDERPGRSLGSVSRAFAWLL